MNNVLSNILSRATFQRKYHSPRIVFDVLVASQNPTEIEIGSINYDLSTSLDTILIFFF
jgi:hypothetical protein